MLNAIIDGIVAAISSEFGDRYPIYTDGVEQGLNEPCFSVCLIRPGQNQVLGNRYFKTNPVCVYFFPSPNMGNTEINAIIEKLFSILEYITVNGDLTRGTNMDSHTESGVVMFNVNYNFFVLRVEDEGEKMQELDVIGNVYGQENEYRA